MDQSRAIRISLLLVVIFAAGMVTGRLTAPPTPTRVPTWTGELATAESRLAMMTGEFGLDAGQQAQFRQLLEEIAKQLAQFPPVSEGRRAVFRQFVPRLRAVLRAEQHPAFDRYVQRTEQRFAQHFEQQRKSTAP